VRLIKHNEVWQANSTFIVVARVAEKSESEDALGCIGAFRGSDDLSNWIEDFKFWTQQVPFPWCDGCRVESGFWSVWEAVQQEVLEALAELGCKPKNSTTPLAKGETNLLAFTGHSLGAAVGSIATVILAQMGFKVGMSYNFESPRFGNDVFASTYDKVFTHQFPTYRVTHALDPVPHLPPRVPIITSSFTHAGFEAYYPGENASVVICKEPESTNCSLRYSLMRTLPHVWDHCTSPVALGGNICFCPAAESQTVFV